MAAPRPEPDEPLLFPDSLCHSCAAPPRYVKSDRGSVFVHCPLLGRYPPQPVLACDLYRRAPGGEAEGGGP